MAITRKLTGWIDVIVKHPESTRPFYETRMYVHKRTRKEIKEDTISYLIGFGLPITFVKTFKIQITHEK